MAISNAKHTAPSNEKATQCGNPSIIFSEVFEKNHGTEIMIKTKGNSRKNKRFTFDCNSIVNFLDTR